MLSRRSLLLGGTASAAALAVAAGLGVEQGVLPGRPWMQAHLGLNGEPGQIPDVPPVIAVSGHFRSEHRLGARTGWTLIQPPDAPPDLPVVVALHGLGEDHASLVSATFAVNTYLAAAIEVGVAPFAIAAVDGGTSYWHPRPDGEDAGAMVVDEFLPLLRRKGLDTDRIGLLGWSMGGYGALRLAGVLGAERVSAVVAASPAIWQDPDDASGSGFADAEEYETYSVLGRQDDLDGIAVRVDCGTGDPFYRAVQDYVAGFTDDADVLSTFEPGAHDRAYWRRMLPDQLAFLGAAVVSTV